MIDISSKTTVRRLWENSVERRGDHEFLVFLDNTNKSADHYTYSDFDCLVNQSANLLHSFGIGQGDKVGVQLGNSALFVECFLAIAKLGAVIVPIGCEDTDFERQYLLDLCEAKVFVQSAEFVTGRKPPSGVFVVTSGSGDADGYETLRDQQSSLFEFDECCEDTDLAEILFTSGTTSKPKGVMLTVANLVFSAYFCNWELQMTADDRYFTTMAVDRVNFQLSALLPVISIGATLILAKKYSASRFWSQVVATKATLVQSMAMIVHTLMRQPKQIGENNHQVRLVHHFLPLSLREKSSFEKRFNVTLVNNYGTSETLVGVITDIPGQAGNWPSIGRPGLGYQAKIVNDSGDEVSPYQVGEILIHGDIGRTLMAGYWKDPVATDAVIDSDGWFHSGDCGYLDDEGWLYFVDRQADIIKRAGENISAGEVQEVLAEFPGIDSIAVIGVPDSIRDEAVKAVVVMEDGQDLDRKALLRFARTRLASYKVPTIIEVRDSLPRGAYGKVKKYLLKNCERTIT